MGRYRNNAEMRFNKNEDLSDMLLYGIKLVAIVMMARIDDQ